MAASTDSSAAQTGWSWPALPLAGWLETRDTLHLWTQIVGKVKVQLSPFLNEWWNVALHPTARGLTTGPVLHETGVFFDVEFDFVTHNLQIRTSGGLTATLPLVAQSVADFYTKFVESLDALGIGVEITPTPDELPYPPIPFAQDRVHASYDPEQVERWWQICRQTGTLLDFFRSPKQEPPYHHLAPLLESLEPFRSAFYGKTSPVHFFWGSFDIAHTRFSGNPAEPPPGSGRLMRLSEDEENVSFGLWPGGGKMTGPAFYSYTYPRPDGIEAALIRPEQAYWDADLGEFILRYDDVRQSDTPEALIMQFFKSAYETGATLRNWDRARLERRGRHPAG